MTVPDDIIEAAEVIIDDVMTTVASGDCMPEGGWRGEFARTFARAILSERNRCAVIARNWQPSSHQDEQYAANTIADRIMSDSKGGE